MAIVDDIEHRCEAILEQCPERIVIPERAQSLISNSFPWEHLPELSDVVWLVFLDLIARQVKHYNQVGTGKSRRAIIIRLTLILDILERLKHYQLVIDSEAVQSAVNRVRGLIGSYTAQYGSPYDNSDNSNYRK